MIATLCAVALGCASVFIGAASDGAVKRGVRVGQRHPDFQLPILDGGLARLSNYRGKKVVLIHFASW